MADNRLTRELDARESNVRPKKWTPPELLPEPDKQPGFHYRWIRVSTLNQADPRNVSAKLREGWEPVTLDRKSTRLNSSHVSESRMPSSA